MPKELTDRERRQIDERLSLLQDFLVDLIKHPEKVEEIPDESTVALIPVKKATIQ